MASTPIQTAIFERLNELEARLEPGGDLDLRSYAGEAETAHPPGDGADAFVVGSGVSQVLEASADDAAAQSKASRPKSILKNTRRSLKKPASVSPESDSEINNLIKEIACRKVIIAKDEGISGTQLKHKADMESAQARLAELQARQRESSKFKHQSASDDVCAAKIAHVSSLITAPEVGHIAASHAALAPAPAGAPPLRRQNASD